jgi:hypothetical protein
MELTTGRTEPVGPTGHGGTDYLKNSNLYLTGKLLNSQAGAVKLTNFVTLRLGETRGWEL